MSNITDIFCDRFEDQNLYWYKFKTTKGFSNNVRQVVQKWLVLTLSKALDATISCLFKLIYMDVARMNLIT